MANLNSNITPNLRFPEFSGAWKETSIGGVLTIGSGKDYKHLSAGDIPVYGTGGYMLSVDDYLYDGESVCIGRKGTIDKPVLLSGKFWTVDTLFYTHSFHNCIPRFIYAYFQTIDWKNYNEASGVPSLSKSTILKIDIKIPVVAEQTKIANFLTAVDEKIAHLTQKHTLLTQYKKGVMQQIFSQQLRFKDDDGRDFPEWEEKAVGEVFKVTRGNVLSMTLVNQVQSETNPYPVYSSQTKNNGLSGFYHEHLYENCITWTTDGANAGDVNYRSGKFYCTNVCGVLVNADGYANACIAAMINSISRNYVSYVGNPKLMNGVMAKITILFPSLLEQTKIANFLTAIDDKLTTVQAQLNAMKQYKQSLLQQMFV
jgi:type I restriction enzyme S subunit